MSLSTIIESESSHTQGETPRASQKPTQTSTRPSLESLNTKQYLVREDGEIIKDHKSTSSQIHDSKNRVPCASSHFCVPDQVGIFELCGDDGQEGYKVASLSDSSKVYCTAVTNWTRRGIPDIALYNHMTEATREGKDHKLKTYTHNSYQQQRTSKSNIEQLKPLVTVKFQNFTRLTAVRIDGHRQGQLMAASGPCNFSADVIVERGMIECEGFRWEKSTSTTTSRYRKTRDMQLVHMGSKRIVALFTKSGFITRGKMGTLTFLDDRASWGNELRILAVVSQLVRIEAKKRKFYPRAVFSRMFLDW